MMPASVDKVNSDMRIASLEQQIREGFGRMEALLSGLDGRLRSVENCQAGQVAAQTVKIDNLDDAIRVLNSKVSTLEEKEIASLKEFRERAEPWIGAVKWLAGVIGIMVITFIGALLTHAIELVH